MRNIDYDENGRPASDIASVRAAMGMLSGTVDELVKGADILCDRVTLCERASDQVRNVGIVQGKDIGALDMRIRKLEAEPVRASVGPNQHSALVARVLQLERQVAVIASGNLPYAGSLGVHFQPPETFSADHPAHDSRCTASYCVERDPGARPRHFPPPEVAAVQQVNDRLLDVDLLARELANKQHEIDGLRAERNEFARLLENSERAHRQLRASLESALGDS